MCSRASVCAKKTLLSILRGAGNSPMAFAYEMTVSIGGNYSTVELTGYHRDLPRYLPRYLHGLLTWSIALQDNAVSQVCSEMNILHLKDHLAIFNVEIQRRTMLLGGFALCRSRSKSSLDRPWGKTQGRRRGGHRAT